MKTVIRVLALVIALIGLIGVTESRDIFSYERVYAYRTDTYTEYFSAYGRAEVIVVGDHDTDLDVYVYDENGYLVGEDDDRSDNCYVSWTPRWSGWFEIRVVNRGGVYNDYRIETN